MCSSDLASTISELNGDAGATATCLLLVDGVEADRAEGIYVDSGSAVTCAFAHAFDATGAHALEVRVADVVPGDWDTANNAVTGSIEIVAGGAPFYWTAVAYKTTTVSTSRSEGWFRTSDGTYAQEQDWQQVYSDTSTWESCGLVGSSSSALTFPLSHAAVEMSADGAVIGSIDLSDVPADWSYEWEDYSTGGLYRYDPATGFYLYITTVTFWGWSNTTAQATRYGGEATYFSHYYSAYWYGYDGATYSYAYNYDDTYSYSYGTWPMTSTAAVNLDIVDANGTSFAAHADMSLQPYQYSWEQPYECYDYAWGYDGTSGGEHYCYGGSRSESEVFGFASGMQ